MPVLANNPDLKKRENEIKNEIKRLKKDLKSGAKRTESSSKPVSVFPNSKNNSSGSLRGNDDFININANNKSSNVNKNIYNEPNFSGGGSAVLRKPKSPLLRRTYNFVKEKQKLPPFDIPFFVGVIFLLAVGLVMLFSASYAKAFFAEGNSYFFISKQLKFAVAGVVGMMIVSFIPYKFYKGNTIAFYLFSIVLLVIVLIVGVGGESYNEKRWLDVFGFFQFQPSEIAKLAVVFILADYISKNKEKMGKFKEGIVYPGFLTAAVALLIVAEPHLSGAILVMAIGIIMIYTSGCKYKYIAIFGGLAAGAGAVVIQTQTYMQDRINTWLHPESDPLGDGFQILQSLYAIGSGGLFGEGLGQSRQKYLYLPEVQNDFIFSVVSEEIGLIGAILILALFAFLIWRGIYIAIKAPDNFSSLVVVGIISRIAVQTLLNIAVVTNSIPVTGISLPFFSYGGTALIILLVEMGIVLQISRFAYVEKE